ncbi:unnamed protein product [Symbiodinium sp. CCMP2592]|nr:unnamed protein product [Symbiodinium sp. CCMP2592]
MTQKRRHDDTPKEILDRLIQRKQGCPDPKHFRKFLMERVSKTTFRCTLELNSSLWDGGLAKSVGIGSSHKEAEQAAAQAYISQPHVAALLRELEEIALEQKATKKARHGL